MTYQELIMLIGSLCVGFIAFGMFISLCVLTRTLRNYYLNAKDEVTLFLEFLQWKANGKNGGEK